MHSLRAVRGMVIREEYTETIDNIIKDNIMIFPKPWSLL